VRSTERLAWVVPLTTFAVLWGVTTHAKYSVTGDEPHYLIVSESLLSDGDIDVSNNYASGDAARFGHPGLGAGTHVSASRAGRMVPVHDIGLPVVLLPVYAAATRLAAFVPPEVCDRVHSNPGLIAYSLIGLFLIGMVALAARVLETALSGLVSPVAAKTAVLALFLAPPVLTTGFLVYPEVPALLATTAAIWLAYRRSEEIRRGLALAIVFGLGLLPWFHRKYFLLSAGLLFVIAWRHRSTLSALDAKGLASLLASYLAPCLALLAWTHSVWGNWHGPLVQPGQLPFSPYAFREGSLGILLDRDCGLLTWSPLYLLFPAAVWVSRAKDFPLLVPALLLFVSSTAHHQWWAGWSPGARFLVPIAALAAVPIARLIGLRRARWPVSILLLAQVLLAAYAWQHPRAPWPRPVMHNEALLTVPVVGRFFGATLPVWRLQDSGVGPLVLGWGMLVVLVSLPLVWIGIRRRND
jgi:hypothetical protein